jgi:hypothetical protein
MIARHAAALAAAVVAMLLPALAAHAGAPLADADRTTGTDTPFAQRPDFNGDGFSDLAAGVPEESLETSRRQGAVSVIYGSAPGLSSSGNQIWTQDSSGILDSAEYGDTFGSAIGWADVNGDGYDDLAVGTPHERLAREDAGAVNVVYGSASGLTSAGNQFWNQDSAGVLDQVETGDLFGTSLVARDFDADGFGDLAIGIIGENAPKGGGAVQVIYGTSAGLSADRNQFWRQLRGKPQKFDRFGEALAAGDFDNDGYPDLAIGADQEDVGHVDDAGAVTILYSSASGLVADGSQYWTQASAGILDDPEPEEWLGRSLTVGNFDGDEYADLAIGIIWENVGAVDSAGAGAVIYGSSKGLASAGNQLWSHDSAGILGTAQPFGTVGDVVSGDFNGDEYADLAIGFHGEDLTRLTDAGAVLVIYGTASGLAPAGNQLWTQNSSGVEETAEADDRFGFALSRGDYNGDGFHDLAIDVRDESVGAASGAGAINVLYGTAAGISAGNDELWTQDSPGILDQADTGDYFGSALVER